MEFNPVQTSPYGVRYKIKSRFWNFVNSTFYRWTPFFMRRTRVMILRLFGANVDWSCSVSARAKIIDPWNLTMGPLSSIDEECCVRCRGSVIIGSKSCISRGTDILSGSHDIYSTNFEMVTSPIVVKDNVWIATGACIGKGVTIGEGSVVAARAVVIKDVEPWTIVGGNPAKFIKKRVIRE